MKQVVFHGVALLLSVAMVNHAAAQYGQNSWGTPVPGNQTRAPYPTALPAPQMQPQTRGIGSPSQIPTSPMMNMPAQNGLLQGAPQQHGVVQQPHLGHPQGMQVQGNPVQAPIHPPVNQNQGCAPAMGAPVYNNTMPMYSSGGCNSGMVGGAPAGGVYGATGGGCASVYNHGQVMGSNAVYGAPVYGGATYGDSCGATYSGPAIAPARNSNWIFGVYGIGFLRDYEDDIILSYNPVGDVLATTNADNGLMGGVETLIGRRGCSGTGWEARYWGLYPGESSASILNATTLLTTTQYIAHPASGFDVYNIYNTSNDHRIFRNNQFHNVELNLLSNAGCNGRRSYEWIAGFRWFEFDEYFRYTAINTGGGGYPTRFDYTVDVSNTLLGFQMGGRKEICLGSKARIHLGGRGGIFNNHMRSRQLFVDDANGYGQLAGNNYDYTSTKNDVAVLGELDLGMSYQFSSCARIRGGYRVIGVSGVALAPNQIPRDFRDALDIQRIKSNGGLILHGFYVGGEFCF